MRDKKRMRSLSILELANSRRNAIQIPTDMYIALPEKTITVFANVRHIRDSLRRGIDFGKKSNIQW
jgi:hypothetical protein